LNESTVQNLMDAGKTAYGSRKMAFLSSIHKLWFLKS